MRSQEECFEILDSIVAPSWKSLPIRLALPRVPLSPALKARTVKQLTGATTVKTKTMRPTLLDQPAGFRIGLGGEVEVLPKAEVDALIDRVIREAMDKAGWPIRRFERTLH
jgi:hypothetical protein